VTVAGSSYAIILPHLNSIVNTFSKFRIPAGVVFLFDVRPVQLVAVLAVFEPFNQSFHVDLTFC
jgi:hypothetical protein